MSPRQRTLRHRALARRHFPVHAARDDDVVKQSSVPTSFTPVAEPDLFRESLSLELGQP